jgi:GNAT superfamily N-acetyltransferase
MALQVPGVSPSSVGKAPGVEVVIGTSQHAKNAELVEHVAHMIVEAYEVVGGHKQMDAAEFHARLCCGDAGKSARRVLHLAFRDGVVVGCVSSSLTTPWTPTGCGHWGLLVVDTNAQGGGVASALVRAAEARLREGGCTHVQIEYEFGPHLPHTQRLADWYQGKLGFESQTGWFINRLIGMVVGCGGTEFRRCRKAL